MRVYALDGAEVAALEAAGGVLSAREARRRLAEQLGFPASRIKLVRSTTGGEGDGGALLSDGDDVVLADGCGGDHLTVVRLPLVRRCGQGLWDGTAKIWSVETGECLLTLEGHEADAAVLSIAFSPDGEDVVLTGSLDDTAKLWSVETGECLFTLKGHGDAVHSVAFSPIGDAVLTCSSDGTAKLWSVRTGECLLTLDGRGDGVFSAVFSPDGGRVLTCFADAAAKIWSTRSGQCLFTLDGLGNPASSAVFSQDGARALTGSWDGTAEIYSLENGARGGRRGRHLFTLKGHCTAAPVRAMAFSPNGRLACTGSWDGTAKFWCAESGECLSTLDGHGGVPLLDVAFCPNGSRLLTASRDGLVKIWSVAGGECLHTLTGHDDAVFSSVFSTDASHVLTSSWDGTTKIWSAEDAACLFTLSGEIGCVTSAAFQGWRRS